MHTLMVTATGIFLLGLFLLAGLALHHPSRCGLYFLPFWLAVTAFNFWFGLSRMNYSFRDEAPIFLLVFTVPAALAALAWWQLPA